MLHGRYRRSALITAGALALALFAVLGTLVMVVRATPDATSAPDVTLTDTAPLDLALEFARTSMPRVTMMVSDGYGTAAPPPAPAFANGLLGDDAFNYDGLMADAFPSKDNQPASLVTPLDPTAGFTGSIGPQQPVGGASARVARIPRNAAVALGTSGVGGGSLASGVSGRASGTSISKTTSEAGGTLERLARVSLQGDGNVVAPSEHLIEAAATPDALADTGGYGGSSPGAGTTVDNEGGPDGIGLASVSRELEQSVAPESFPLNLDALVEPLAAEAIPAPEPASLVLFGSGLAATAWHLRRRRTSPSR